MEDGMELTADWIVVKLLAWTVRLQPVAQLISAAAGETAHAISPRLKAPAHAVAAIRALEVVAEPEEVIRRRVVVLVELLEMLVGGGLAVLRAGQEIEVLGHGVA